MSMTTADQTGERMKVFRIFLKDSGTPLITLEAVWRKFARPFLWKEFPCRCAAYAFSA